MRNQHGSGKMLQNMKYVAPQLQNAPITPGTSLWPFVCMTLLVSSLLLMGLPLQGQDLSKKQNQILSQQSGFLSDYSKLQPDPKDSGLLIYWANPDFLKHSTKFMLNPLIVYMDPEQGVDPEDLVKMDQLFIKAITDELTQSGHYEIATEPGPGVMLLRLAITHVQTTGGKKNAAVKGATTAASVALVPGVGLLVPRLSVGSISVEGEFVDSVSGAPQAEFMASKTGRRYFSGLKQFKSWGDIEAAFKSWAKDFRQRLDAAQS
jgi:Protein of unknown function (DUF3313)